MSAKKALPRPKGADNDLDIIQQIALHQACLAEAGTQPVNPYESLRGSSPLRFVSSFARFDIRVCGLVHSPTLVSLTLARTGNERFVNHATCTLNKSLEKKAHVAHPAVDYC